ncbi:hypothetical protein BDN72DRAFT_747657, partial [Pluteus cervinus]
VRSFIKCVLGVGSEEDGLFGKVSGYYGCVEAQGRGTLHCHMLVWLEDSLNPTEIQQLIQEGSDPAFGERLISFLDDAITNHLPEDLREKDGESFEYPLLEEDNVEGKKDFCDLISQCQLHYHSPTCYKYHKGSGPKECRFGLGEGRELRENTSFDLESGEIFLRQLHSRINNFNTVVMQCLRNNMDIKYVGSGPTAKAVIYYITDYITKSPLNAQIAFTAIQAALKSLEAVAAERREEFDERNAWGKKLLQKCAFALIAKQELSAQQVASLLMDYGESYTSHSFKQMFWTKSAAVLKRHLEGVDPNLGIVNNSGPNSDEQDDRVNANHVVVSVEHGEFVQFVQQGVDYEHRPTALSNMCLWDYVRCTEK